MAKVEICSWRRSGRDALDKDINLTLLLQQQWLTNEQSRLILQQVGPKLKWGLSPPDAPLTFTTVWTKCIPVIRRCVHKVEVSIVSLCHDAQPVIYMSFMMQTA